jgi:4-hydroxyphenylpyruvate dioxygenase
MTEAPTANPPTGNPMGTDGFEFVEFTAPDAKGLGDVFEALGFRVVGRHRSKNVLHYRQGDINLIVNAEPASPAEQFATAHGPSACAMVATRSMTSTSGPRAMPMWPALA